MIRIDRQRTAGDLLPAIDRVFDLSAQKIRSIEETWRPEDGSPVFTVDGIYKSRGWTEWTQGFQFGAPLLQFDATADREFLELGRSRTLERMAPHLTHVGVHDHGFNNVSTYGNLWRLAREGKFDAEPWEVRLYALALRVSGAVQARRWTPIPGGGFIHSFNGAHSLFVDTIRTLRALALSHVLGHRLFEEQDAPVNLLERLLLHARATAEYSVYFGTGRDTYDVRGRTAHESLFNRSEWHVSGTELAAGLLAVLDLDARSRVGDAGVCRRAGVSGDDRSGEVARLKSSPTEPEPEPEPEPEQEPEPMTLFMRRAMATCDFYIDHAAAADGVPYWDTGAPGLDALGDWGSRPADPFNEHEPVDSSAAAIAAQGLLRLARVAAARGADGDTIRAGRTARARNADRRDGSLSEPRRSASGAAAALDLSPPERMGSRARRLAHSARRVEHVGRLPSARSALYVKRIAEASHIDVFWK